MTDDFPAYAEFEEQMQATINKIKSNVTFLTAANDLQQEDAIGSDVAQVQSTECNANTVEDEDDMMNVEDDDDDTSLPLWYSFVLLSCQDDQLNNSVKLKAFQKMVNSGSTMTAHEEFETAPFSIQRKIQYQQMVPLIILMHLPTIQLVILMVY